MSKYSHRRSAFACRIPATGLHVDDQSRCQAHATWRVHCLGLTENLCNGNVVQTLLPLQQIESHAASCRSIETSDFQKLCVRHPSSNSVRHSAARFAPRSRSIRSSKHSTRMSPLDRFTSELIGGQLGKLPGPRTSVSLNQCARHCHHVPRVQQWEFVMDPCAFLFSSHVNTALSLKSSDKQVIVPIHS